MMNFCLFIVNLTITDSKITIRPGFGMLNKIFYQISINIKQK